MISPLLFILGQYLHCGLLHVFTERPLTAAGCLRGVPVQYESLARTSWSRRLGGFRIPTIKSRLCSIWVLADRASI